MRYRFKMVLLPGKQLITAHGLSRAPIKNNQAIPEELTVGEVNTYSLGFPMALGRGQDFVTKVKERQATGPVCKFLLRLCERGWPVQASLSWFLHPYWPERALITQSNGFLLKGARLIVPQEERRGVGAFT